MPGMPTSSISDIQKLAEANTVTDVIYKATNHTVQKSSRLMQSKAPDVPTI